MPRYTFQCPNKNCQKTFSEQVPMGTENLVCPQCGTRAEKIFSAPNIHFRGSGFYVSDSKKKSTSSEKKETSPTTEPPKAPASE